MVLLCDGEIFYQTMNFGTLNSESLLNAVIIFFNDGKKYGILRLLDMSYDFRKGKCSLKIDYPKNSRKTA